jgi:putative ABC transport system permease protein
MVRNYFIVAVRNLLKNKVYVIINILGLGIALACCITAYLLLAFNIEFDDFHDNKKVANIFKIHVRNLGQDGKPFENLMAPMPLGPFAAQEVAGIEKYTRFIFGGGSLSYADKAFTEGIAFADSTFFDMFEYPFISGSQNTFKEKYCIILDEEKAKKYFADEDPTGKLITLNFANDFQVEAKVGGVMKKVPLNNTFVPGIMMRIEVFQDYNNLEPDNWGDWRDPTTFLSLASPEQAGAITKQLNRYIPVRNEKRKDMTVDEFRLEPFKSYFTGDDIQGSYVVVRMPLAPLVIFVAMAAVILLIACFNLTNTSIALAGKRLKEVGIRKVTGATGMQLVLQFLLETAITITLSLFIGIMIAQLIVPAFATMWGLPYGLADLNSMNLLLAMMVLLFLTSFISGIYPAFYNSRFKPAALLKGTVKFKGSNYFTRTLVALQFALSVVVLIAGVVFIQNTRFQEGINFGYDVDRVITVRIQGEREYKAMENAILANPQVLSVSVSDGNLGSNNYQAPVEVDTGTYEVRAMGIGNNYFETMGLGFIQGRTLNTDNNSDFEEGVVVNQAFLGKTGISDPIDHIVVLHQKRRRIVGVVNNHVDNLYRSKDPEPFIFYPAAINQYFTMQVKTEPENIGAMQQYLEKTWKEIFPGKPFSSDYQDELVLGNIRQTNSNLEKIFLFITILGGLLSASGIFALASLNIARRTKEIGIRKALGATINSIVALFNKEFIILLLLAGIAGSFGGFYLTNVLLDEIYAYRIPITIVTIITCALIIFFIGILTTSSTILKAARSNPVDTLRNE